MLARLCLFAAAIIVPSLALQGEAGIDDNDNAVVALPTEALVLPPVGRYGRTPIPVDALQASICAGAWKAPKSGDTLNDPDGKERKWFTVPIKNGSVKHSALAGGCAFFSVPSPAEQVMILEAAGHTLVQINGEPRVGDVYQTGYVRVPMLLRKGANEFLFHVARGSLRAKLVAPKATAQLHLGDVTLPNLLVGKEADAHAAVVVLNAGMGTIAGLRITATLPRWQTDRDAAAAAAAAGGV
jgi:hypothetical protein